MTRPLMVRLFWGGLVILVTAALLLRVVPVAAPTNPVGETVQGVRVQKVEREEVTFSLDRNETATWVNAERDRRRKAFERRGLHLGNEEDRTP